MSVSGGGRRNSSVLDQTGTLGPGLEKISQGLISPSGDWDHRFLAFLMCDERIVDFTQLS